MQTQVQQASVSAYRSAPRLKVSAYRLALFTVLLGSLGLRLIGIGWGLPDYDPNRVTQGSSRSSYHLDEDNFLWGLASMHPSQGDLDVKDYHWGTLQFYLIDGVLLASEATGLLKAPWEDGFRHGDVAVLSRVYPLGRLVSVAAGVIGTALVCMLGSVVAGRMAGLAAGAAYSIAPLAVVESHYLTNDVTMSVLVAGAVLAAVLGVRRRGAGWLMVSGLLLGLGVAAKYSAASALPALVVAQIGLWRLSRVHGRSRSPWRIFLLPLLALAAGFIAGEPYVLIAPGEVLRGVSEASQGNLLDPANGPKAVIYILASQARFMGKLGLTWPLALLSAAGVGLLIAAVGRAWRRTSIRAGWLNEALPSAPSALPSLVLLAGVVGIIAGIGLNGVLMLRYNQPLVPLLAVCAGVAWAALPRLWLRAAVGALAVAVALLISVGQLSLMLGPHPANQLLAWLQPRLRPGQEVAQTRLEYPPLDGGGYVTTPIDPWAPALPPGSNPDYIIMDNMIFHPPTTALADLLARDYRPVATFSANPHIGPFAWDEGDTPHDWKYSHPTLVVYQRQGPAR